ncbi:hypothetical protein [Natranaerofaba carboxydovora]|uniref:hypothetical protein n=1 Tax=Natranaerofaba carboxydovora TaxID=2742683 RepID=UPI001F136A34|nr:hypothetical protein [Natranaerofaba carboxydovora]
MINCNNNFFYIKKCSSANVEVLGTNPVNEKGATMAKKVGMVFQAGLICILLIKK